MRRLLILIACLVGLCLASGCDGDPARDSGDGVAATDAVDTSDVSDVARDGDAATDAIDDSGDVAVADDLTCENVVDKWDDFVRAHKDCQDDSDCRVVSDWAETCNCHPSLTGGAVGINRSASGVQRYLDKFHSDACADEVQWHDICDSGPPTSASCNNGRCSAYTTDCDHGPMPDGG
jgi:hypothetical protein